MVRVAKAVPAETVAEIAVSQTAEAVPAVTATAAVAIAVAVDPAAAAAAGVRALPASDR
jgi:hypothetical protein